jgi:putative glutathione S-transferase
MSVSEAPFTIGQDEQRAGAFIRQSSRFREWVTPDGANGYAAEPGRYHLYVARACPWAHRTIIARALMGLEQAITISYVDPIRDARGWEFSTPGAYEDPVNGFRFLSQAYRASDPQFAGRATVPVLWDRKLGRIVNNESADILRMLSTVFAPLATHPASLYPAALAAEIDALNERIYEHVNNGVYRAGFSTSQPVYEQAVRDVFALLDELDARLADRRFLFGPEPVETDWRLFTTLVRFDPVYHVHFKCSLRKLREYPSLWPYLRDLYQWPGVRETVSFDEIRAHYYRTHRAINPAGIVAVMPSASLEEAPGRECLG